MIAAHDVCKAFEPSRPILDHATLEVGRGEYVALTGDSGSGKSTLLHLLAALDRADAGHIVIDGHDLDRHHHLDEYRRRSIGLVFQLHNLLPNLTARQNVEVAMYGTGRRRASRVERSLELLGDLGLGEFADVNPPRLSGGERQRVAIARALANDPAVLLADEPTGSLDATSTTLLVDLFRRLRDERGLTILVVTHDPIVATSADRTLRLASGRIGSTSSTPATHAAGDGRSAPPPAERQRTTAASAPHRG
jgi:putative ABC transport system ATP-binding protein